MAVGDHKFRAPKGAPSVNVGGAARKTTTGPRQDLKVGGVSRPTGVKRQGSSKGSK